VKRATEFRTLPENHNDPNKTASIEPGQSNSLHLARNVKKGPQIHAILTTRSAAACQVG